MATTKDSRQCQGIPPGGSTPAGRSQALVQPRAHVGSGCRTRLEGVNGELGCGSGREPIVTLPVCRFAGPGDAAKGLVQRLRGQGKRWTALPYNRFQPGESDWYVVPASGTDARRGFRFGKVLFRTLPRGRLFTGLYVEKGLALRPEVLSVWKAVPREAVLGPGWAWHSLLQGLEVGDVDDASRRAAAEAGADVHVHVAVSEFSVPSERTTAAGMDWKQHLRGLGLFSWRLVEGRLTDAEATETDPSVERLLGDTRDLADLGARLGRLESSNVRWVDVMVGFYLARGGGGEGAQAAWGAAELEDYVVAPWSRWLR